MFDSAISIVQAACDKESDCVDNYPENLQSTGQFERMEDAADNLNEALEKLDEAKERLDEAKELLLAAIG